MLSLAEVALAAGVPVVTREVFVLEEVLVDTGLVVVLEELEVTGLVVVAGLAVVEEAGLAVVEEAGLAEEEVAGLVVVVVVLEELLAGTVVGLAVVVLGVLEIV